MNAEVVTIAASEQGKLKLASKIAAKFPYTIPRPNGCVLKIKRGL